MTKDHHRAGCFPLCPGALCGLDPEQGGLQMFAGPWGQSTKHLPASPLGGNSTNKLLQEWIIQHTSHRPVLDGPCWGSLGWAGGQPLSPLSICLLGTSAVPTASSYPTCPTEASYGRWLAEGTTGSLFTHVLGAKQVGFVARGRWGSSVCLQGNTDAGSWASEVLGTSSPMLTW